MRLKLSAIFIILSFLSHLYGQVQDTIPINLKEVEISVFKLSRDNLSIPRAISNISLQQNQKLQSQVSLQEYLNVIPGLFSLNQNNFAQDIRVSIRGFGARSAFGIRGVKIVIDGIPETTPDGQGQVDNIPLNLLSTVESIRGPSASLFGNASGGVLYFKTIDSLEKDTAQLRFNSGSFGLASIKATVGLKGENTSAVLFQNFTDAVGYRQNSRFKQRVFNAKVIHTISDKSNLVGQVNYTHSPIAQDPGGLNLKEYKIDRSRARQNNLRYETYETIKHFKSGLNYYRELNEYWSFQGNVFYTNRDFYGKLPFEFGGIVAIQRNYYGANTNLSYDKSNLKLQIGIEGNNQRDQRQRYRNIDGSQGSETFAQLEKFSNISAYSSGYYQIKSIIFQGGLRYDQQHIGADSTTETKQYKTLNPSLGIGLKLGRNLLFSNISTSFETPALSELSADPSGIEGLNFDLNPSQAIGYEIGWKWNNQATNIELVSYHTTTSNEIVPYEIEAFPNRSFYRNAGETIRKGIELYFRQGFNFFTTSVAYSISNNTFQEFLLGDSDLSGNRLPGLPKQQLNFQLRSRNIGSWDFLLSGTLVGEIYADDANQTKIDPYQVINLSLQKSFDYSSFSIDLFAGINNLFNRDYFDNIRINAFGGRYYEPAPLRNIFVGISIGV